jgi:hypothetical protein
MRIRRGLLFAGLFLIPVGAMTLLVRAGTLDPDAFDDIWRFWPLILIGFGIAILLGRSRVAAVGTAIAAVVLGVLVGGAIASGGAWIGNFGECGPASANAERIDKTGTFDGRSAIDLDLRCGSVTVTTASGSAWQLGAAFEGPAPIVNESSNRLEVRTPDGGDVRHNDWTVIAPTDALAELRLRTNAGTASVTLAGSALDALDVDANAGDILIDGAHAEIGRLDVAVNAGRARITLENPAAGDLSINAGAIDLCVPPSMNLRLVVNDQLTFVTNLADQGLQQNGQVWTRTPTPGDQQPMIDLTVTGNAASFTLDPDGGCR